MNSGQTCLTNGKKFFSALSSFLICSRISCSCNVAFVCIIFLYNIFLGLSNTIYGGTYLGVGVSINQCVQRDLYEPVFVFRGCPRRERAKRAATRCSRYQGPRPLDVVPRSARRARLRRFVAPLYLVVVARSAVLDIVASEASHKM